MGPRLGARPFQSTPVIAGGRTHVMLVPYGYLRRFQSTPVIAGGRTPFANNLLITNQFPVSRREPNCSQWVGLSRVTDKIQIVHQNQCFTKSANPSVKMASLGVRGRNNITPLAVSQQTNCSSSQHQRPFKIHSLENAVLNHLEPACARNAVQAQTIHFWVNFSQ